MSVGLGKQVVQRISVRSTVRPFLDHGSSQWGYVSSVLEWQDRTIERVHGPNRLAGRVLRFISVDKGT